MWIHLLLDILLVEQVARDEKLVHVLRKTESKCFQVIGLPSDVFLGLI